MAARIALVAEIMVMALETLRANKLRSALTILGVVIGVTSIVAMTALIRGFGDNLQALIQQMGSDTIYVSKMSISSFAAGKDFLELMKRPNLTEADAQAVKTLAPSAGFVTYHLGEGPGGQPQRFTYRNTATKRMPVLGAEENWLQVNFLKVAQGRFFSEFEVQRRRQVVVLGDAPAGALFPAMDPIGKQIRIGKDQFTVVGVIQKRPALLGNSTDEFAIVPATTYQKLYPTPRFRGYLMRFLVIGAVARDGATREQLLSEVEQILRSRHRLRIDQENDFDVLTSDSIMAILDQLTRAVVLALVVISSIALMVGGIGVMAIMTISVTERTREIGVRKAIGAKRLQILWQFLVEAVVLTSLGGLLGMALGAGIGIGVNSFAGFPVSLPWWSFALGLSFSISVGIFFGLYPAFKASKLDPIEALRYE
ncbi:MAG: ABC transporter permease [Acidobacteria bacterium]|nr:ABC transporter permease [Acidobacteriota bacterium]